MASRLKPPAELPPRELLLLNEAQAAKELASERLAHARTRADLMKMTAEMTRFRTELAAREADEMSRAKIREAVADHDAAHKALAELTIDIRQTFNLTSHHCIDGSTGAVTLIAQS